MKSKTKCILLTTVGALLIAGIAVIRNDSSQQNTNPTQAIEPENTKATTPAPEAHVAKKDGQEHHDHTHQSCAHGHCGHHLPQLTTAPIEAEKIEDPYENINDPEKAAYIASEPWIIREEIVEFPVSLKEIADADKTSGNQTKRIDVQLFGNINYPVIVTNHSRMGATGGSYVGAIENIPGSQVILGYEGEAEAGTFIIPGKNTIQISYAGDGLHKITEINPALLPRCAHSDGFQHE